MGSRRKITAEDAEPTVDVLEWEGKTLFLAFPCYKTTNPVTAMTLVHMALDFGAAALVPQCRFGDAMIYHARNRLADMFLESGCEWCLWVDDDMVLPTGRPKWFKTSCRLPDSYPMSLAGAHAAKRLMSHGLPLVAGSYVTRNPTGRLVSSAGDRAGYLNPVSPSAVSAGRLIPVDWAGTGCMLTHRSVFEKMKAANPELAPRRKGQAWNFFKPLDDGRGEDQAFCQRAKAMGVQPMLDLGVQCMHIGYMAYHYK